MRLKIALIFLVSPFLQCKTQKSADQPVSPANIPTLAFLYWKLVEIDGKPVVTPDSAQEVYMILAPIDKGSGVLKGHAGCNGLGGDYKIDGNSIKFQPITTRMYCESQMQTEN